MLPRLDLLALFAAVIALAVAVLYLFLVSTEGSSPAAWAVAVLVIGGVGAAYAVRVRSPYRRVALLVGALCLLPLGYLAIFSIGLPLLLAGSLCAAAALRARPQKDWRDAV